MRINKFLAHCGVASRRKSERYILEGRITVNGKVETNLSYLIKNEDTVEFDGMHLVRPKKYEYYILHKPKDYICTSHDEFGRRNVTDLIHSNSRIFSVGRLDKDTTGLLLLTDDGDFANKILHPRYNIMRKYYAYTKEELSIKNIATIKKGIYLSRNQKVSAQIKKMGFEKGKYKWRVILTEGKNREIRRIFHRFEIKVYNLHRYAFGKLTLKDIDRGKSKKMTEAEIKKIFQV